jgi:sugar/nucleoside kinase (ribokinase family)
MQYRGLFVGLTTIDIQYHVETFPASNRKVKTPAPEILVGGPATNAAIAFSKLNEGAFLASPVGINPFQSFCADDFKCTNLTHFDLVEQKNANPIIASVITSEITGDRNIFSHHPEKISSEISAKELLDKTNPEILLIDSFYPEFSIECARIAKEKNIPVVVDGGSWKPQYNLLLEYTDIIICSNDFYPPGCNNSKQVIEFLKLKKVMNIAISRGENSILFDNVKNRGEVSICKTYLADTLGAGDFLHGAFCYYYLKSKDFKFALNKASKIASFSCGHKGTREWLKRLK